MVKSYTQNLFRWMFTWNINARINYWYTSKDDEINIMNNFSLIDKMRVLQFFFAIYKKMNKRTYYQRNREIILNKAKDYYENDKEWLREQARNKYRNLFEEHKKKKREYGKDRYHNMSEEKKQKLKE